VVSGQTGGNQKAAPVQGRQSQQYYRNAPPPRRDPFPIIIAGIFGLLVVGLLVLVYLFSSNSNNNNTAGAVPTTPPSSSGQTVATVAPVGVDTTPGGPTEEPPPRMALADFMTLYNDPAKRPLIIDVRAKEAYDAGHIAGAISFPESDVDTRINELPKDKLIIAYCQ